MKDIIKYRHIVRCEEPSPNKHRTLLFIESAGGVDALIMKYENFIKEIDKLLNLCDKENANTRILFYDYCSSLIFDEIRSINKGSNFAGLRCMFVDDYKQYIKELKALCDQGYDNSDIFNAFISRITAYGNHIIDKEEYKDVHHELCDYIDELESIQEPDIQKMWDDYNSPLSDVYNQLETYDLRISDLIETANHTLYWTLKINNEISFNTHDSNSSTSDFNLSDSLICTLDSLVKQYPIKKGRNQNGKIQASIIESLHHAKIVDLHNTSLLGVLNYLRPKIRTLGSYKVISEHYAITHNPNDEFVKTLLKAAF